MLSKFWGKRQGKSVPSKTVDRVQAQVESLERRQLLSVGPSGLDPSNMGKGDFIEDVSKAAVNLNSDSYEAFAKNIKSGGFRWVVVQAGKGDDGPLLNYGDGKGSPTVGSYSQQFNRDLIDALHAAGLKVLGYQTIYGGGDTTGEDTSSTPALEQKVAKDILSLGADGLIADAEKQFEAVANNGTIAENYCNAVKAVYPGALLGLETFAYVSQHTGMPYQSFAKHVDVMMPQDYWVTLTTPNNSPTKMVTDMDTEWKKLYDGFRSQGHPEWVRPIVPIGQGANTDTEKTTQGMIDQWYSALKNDGTPASPNGYNGTSFWNLEGHTPEIWKGIVNNDIGAPGGIVTGTVFNDVDGDGGQSTTVEPGMIGRVVYADENRNGVLDSTEPRTTTDRFGHFSLFWLPAGDHVIRQQSPNSQWRETTPGSFTVTVLENQTSISGSFGVTNNPWVHGVIFNDTNDDGTRQDTERGIKGAFVWADENHDGKFNKGEPFTVTNSKGRYNITVGVGNYQIRHLPVKGYRSVSPGTGYQSVAAIKHGAGYEGFNFGDTNHVLIKGTVFSDVNRNGIKDAGEGVFAGRTVYLDINGDGLLDSGDISALTNAKGAYRFSVAAGTYLVRANFGKRKVKYIEPGGGVYNVTLKRGKTATGRDFAVILS